MVCLLASYWLLVLVVLSYWVISKVAVYCIWLMVVMSMLSVDVSSIFLSKVLTTLFSFLSFFNLDHFFVSFIGWDLTSSSSARYSSFSWS